MSYVNLDPETACQRFGAAFLEHDLPLLCPADFSGLRGHQDLMAKAMRHFETKHDFMQDTVQDALGNHVDVAFSSTMAILACEAGSGKTLTFLRFLLSNPQAQDDPVKKNFGLHPRNETHILRHVRVLSRRQFCLPTLLVIPADLLPQWKFAMIQQIRMPSSSFLVIEAYNHSAWGRMRSVAEAAANSPLLIVMTNKSYERFCKSPEFNTCVFQRFVVDEADSIMISKYHSPCAHFTWFITATPQNLYTNDCVTQGLQLNAKNPPPRVEAYLSNPIQRKNRQTSRTIDYDEIWWPLITLSCDVNYIAQNVQLPRMHRTTVYFQRAALYEVLSPAMSSQAAQALRAGDVRTAIGMVQCTTAISEEGLVANVTYRLREKESFLVNYIEFLRNNPSHPDATNAKIEDLVRELERARERVAAICERLCGEVCPITMDPIITRAATPCCNISFEAEALLRAIEKSARCPWCRNSLTASSITIVNGNGTTGGGSDGSSENLLQNIGTSEVPFESVHAALKHVVARIFASRPDAKVLVFSQYDMERVQDEVVAVLGDNGTAMRPRGARNRINVILDAFRNGAPMPTPSAGRGLPVRVLLLDAVHFGAGHNIECATHIVTVHDMTPAMDHQIIGRAQRWGRTEELQVYDIRMTM